MMKKEIKCPQCGHLTFYAVENPFRPFCSERCRIIDLGDWASESFKISHVNNDDSQEDEIDEKNPSAESEE